MTKVVVGILFVYLLFVSSFAYTSDEQEVFSSYANEFQVSTIYGTPRVTKFTGQVSVTGEVVFRFDMLSETEIGELMFADFIPDKKYADTFPQVVEGFYAKPLSNISLMNGEESLRKVFTEDEIKQLSSESNGTISKQGVVLLYEYSVYVECDSRQYTAFLASFEYNNSAIASHDMEELSGC